MYSQDILGTKRIGRPSQGPSLFQADVMAGPADSMEAFPVERRSAGVFPGKCSHAPASRGRFIPRRTGSPLAANRAPVCRSLCVKVTLILDDKRTAGS